MLINKTVSLDSDMLDAYAKKYGYGNVSERIRNAMDMYYANELKKEVKKT